MKILQNFGLTEKESQIFLISLELGAQPPSVLARHANTPRSSIYHTLEKLEKMGLMKKFMRRSIKYFECEQLESIVDIMERKNQKFENNIQLFVKAIPQLNKLKNNSSITPKVNFYEGIDAIEKMYDQVTKEKSFYAYFNPQLLKKAMPKYDQKIPQVIKSKYLQVQELLIDSKEAQEYQTKYQSKNHLIKILSQSDFFQSDTIITTDKIYMIAYEGKEISAIEIFNKTLAETQQIMFNKVWEIS